MQRTGKRVNTWNSANPSNLPDTRPHPTMGKTTVYAVADGAALQVEPIDAKELIASGAYSLTAQTTTTE